MRSSPRYELSSSEVHLLLAPLDLGENNCQELWGYLSDNERQRALRYRFVLHRNRFIAGRAILRQILGWYLGKPPNIVAIAEGDYGKPTLACPEGAHLQFNVSHSESLAAYAVARDRRIGVDIEGIRPIPDRDSIAQMFFATEEQLEIAAAPPDRRDFAFLACWTRKEAYLKAHGLGLSLPLHSFATSGAGRPGLIRVDSDASDIDRWLFKEFTVFTRFVGSLVVEGRQWRLMTRIWPDESTAFDSPLGAW